MIRAHIRVYPIFCYNCYKRRRAHLQIEMLTYLAGVAKGPVQKVEVLINIITVTFDMNQPTQASAWDFGQNLL